MAIEKYFKQIIFVSLFLAALNHSWGQSDENGFFQRLWWTGGEYAMHYEVIIETEEAGVFRTTLRELTEEQYIKVSLSPGRYRIQVIPYDFLYRPGTPSQWMSFVVLPVPDQEFFIGTQEPGTQEPQPGLEPVAAADEPPAAAEVLPATPTLQTSTFLGLAWMPLFTVYGDDNRFLADNSTLIGLAAWLGIVSDNTLGFINPGIELGLQWYAFNSVENAPMFNYLTVEVNFLAQRRLLNDLMAVNLRLGGGVSLLLNRSDMRNFIQENNLSMESEALFVNIGVSFQYFVRGPFFIELGVDYSHMFTAAQTGILRPWFGLGLRF